MVIANDWQLSAQIPHPTHFSGSMCAPWQSNEMACLLHSQRHVSHPVQPRTTAIFLLMTISSLSFPGRVRNRRAFSVRQPFPGHPGNSDCLKYIMPNFEIKDLNRQKIDVYCRKHDIFNKTGKICLNLSRYCAALRRCAAAY